MTCRTCLTLNPPGAPACVRCNTPLTAPAARTPAATATTPAATATTPAATAPTATTPAPPATTPAPPAPPDPTTGSKQLGPGLAASGRAAPGSSRAAAATVQPPGYGPPPEPEAPPGPAPADRRRDRRRVALAGLLLVALVLAGGGTALWLTRPSYLDTAAVASAVGAELTARLGGSVVVTCPDTVRSRTGETFACTARDAGGTSRQVTVTLLDDAGRYRWELGR